MPDDPSNPDHPLRGDEDNTLAEPAGDGANPASGPGGGGLFEDIEELGDTVEDVPDRPAGKPRSGTSPPTDVPGTDSDDIFAGGQHPDRIGPFRIRGVLGQGGMGVVYRAEQDSPRREVALKVVRPGYATPEIMRRFAHESQILGKLQHPGIAQVYQAGTADTGAGPQPFFAMELVHGPTLSAYIEQESPSLRARLELMVQICDAVQHAHTKGVIHRDLKPANVIVTNPAGDQSGARQPKILDFGVARATDADIQSATIQTTAGQLVGTVPYMSPEQVAADPEALDTRSDVYALGVMLFEVLSGELPHDLRRVGIAEAARIIGQVEPTKLGTHGTTLRGDLETIAAKTLEKEPDRRYQSAAELGEELGRYLRDEPIEARRASTVYQLRKFARRNRSLVAAGAVAAGVLALGVAGTAWQAIDASRQAVAAQQAEAKAVAINEFLVKELLGAANPAVAQGEDVTVLELFRTASERVGTALADEPELEMTVRGVLGEVLVNLADGPGAQREFDRVAELTAIHLGPTHEETLAAQHALADLDARMGRLADARARIDDVLPRMREHLGPDHIETLKAEGSLGRVMLEMGDLAGAEEILRRSAEAIEAKLGPDDIQTMTTWNNLATALKDLRRFDEAEAVDRDLLERRTRVFGALHPDTLTSMNNRAALLQLMARTEEATALFEQTLEGRRAVLGTSHPSTLTTMNNMADAAIRAGDFERAEALLSEAIEGLTAAYGPRHPTLLTAQNNLAYVFEETDRDELAEPLYRNVLATRLEVLGPTRPETLSGANNLGMLLQRTGRLEEAAEYLSNAARGSAEVLGEDHFYTAIFENNYGDCLTDLGRYDEAIELITRSGAVLAATLGEDHERSTRSRARLARAEAGRSAQ